jgi:hypothetical protein
MGELLKNKKVIGVVVALLLAGLSAVVGYSVKDEVCGAPAAAIAAPAAAAPAAAPAK